MRCPKCGSDSLSVIDSRSEENSIRRRRECSACASRFTTYERIELNFPMVIKKDGQRQPFDTEKLRSGILKACEKRPVSMEQIDHVVDVVMKKVLEGLHKEIPSIKVGDFVMEELKAIDKVAYVRFASVYREFSDVSEFEETLKSLA